MGEEGIIKEILTNSKTIAVIGLSPKPDRASYGVAKYLKTKGYKIIPIYPREEFILEEKVYRKISDVTEKIDTVLIFKKSEDVLPFVEEAIPLKPSYVWMQQGIVNEAAAELAEENGMKVIMDRCMYVEHARLMR